MKEQLSRACLVLMLMGLPTALAGAAEPPRIKPIAGPLDAGAGFAFSGKQKKTRQSLSGIACPGAASAPGRCLAVFDEGGEARSLTIDGNAIRPDPEPVVLLPGKVELDGEAAATDGTFFYVAGSHSAKRSIENGICASNPESRHLIRFRIDRATGRGQRDAAGRLVDVADTGALWTVMSTLPGLKAHVGDGMCLGPTPPGRNGVNIEGLAIQDGRLFVGFRGPVTAEGAKILSVDAEALFGGRDADPKLFTIAVGAGRAVRDLIAVSDGILVLAGPDDDPANQRRGFSVLRWNRQNGGGTIQPLATLDLSGVTLRGCDKETKPEAIAILADAPGQPYEAAIFSDGLCDGGALRFRIPR